MKLLVIGAGMMGSAAAYDMAFSAGVEAVTLVDADAKRAKEAATRIEKLAHRSTARTPVASIRIARIDAADRQAVSQLMENHDAALSAVPYFFNLGLVKAAIDAKCHFADLGGNNDVVRETLVLAKKAERRGVALAPDCGLSPGLGSLLAGELVRRISGENDLSALSKRSAQNPKPPIDALKLYVGGLPANPKPPFQYQLVFSVEGLINEFVEPAKVLKDGQVTYVEPLSEPEDFPIDGFGPLIAFHTSGGTSTLPETFAGIVAECFEKTLRFPDHFKLIRGLHDLGLFSSARRRIGNAEISPRQLTAQLFLEKMSGNEPDVTIMRVEAHARGKIASFTLIDHYDPATNMTAMMRTTAWPASIVVQMLASGEISRRGAVLQERDVPATSFLHGLENRGICVKYEIH